MSDALPLVRLVPEVLDVPLPRRTALVPVLPEDGVEDDEPPLRVDAELDEPPLEPDEDEPELPEPEEPLDPLDGGAERTGCCSGYAGAEYDDDAGDEGSRSTA